MKVVSILGALGVLVASSASALSPGVDFISPGLQGNSSNWTLGYEFVAKKAVAVTALGVFDYNQDGLVGPQQVGLWDTAGNLLASTYVDNSDPLSGFWRFRAISPVNLTDDTLYVVGSQGGEGYAFLTSGLTVDPHIGFIKDRWRYNGNGNNTPLVFPDQTSFLLVWQGGGFFGGNVAFGPTNNVVPEPGSLALLFGAAISGAGLIIRRRRGT